MTTHSAAGTLLTGTRSSKAPLTPCPAGEPGDARRQARGRVLLIDLGGSFGGVESYLVSLAPLLSEDLDLYGLCVLPELAQRLSGKGVKVVRLPLCPGLFKPLRFLAAFAILPGLLLRYRIHAVQLNGFLESVLVFPARLLGRKAICTRHGPFELDQYRWWRHPHKVLPRALARLSARCATHVVCVSGAVEHSVQRLLPRSRYSIISNWVSNQPAFRAVRASLIPRARILCVSRLERYKGVHLLLSALREIEAGTELIVLGDGSYRTELEQMAAGWGNIHFLGFQSDMHRFYADADIFVMPSMGPEGLPMVSLEAMAHGLPCIFSDLPVHREITDNGQGAHLFRSGDAESLRAALQALLADSCLRQRYAAKAHSILVARYTEDIARNAYLRVFTEGTSHA